MAGKPGTSSPASDSENRYHHRFSMFTYRVFPTYDSTPELRFTLRVGQHLDSGLPS